MHLSRARQCGRSAARSVESRVDACRGTVFAVGSALPVLSLMCTGLLYMHMHVSRVHTTTTGTGSSNTVGDRMEGSLLNCSGKILAQKYTLYSSSLKTSLYSHTHALTVKRHAHVMDIDAGGWYSELRRMVVRSLPCSLYTKAMHFYNRDCS